MTNNIRTIASNSRIYLKIGFIFLLILILMIPSSLITDLIRERSSLKESVVSEISQTWGRAQNITGPVIILPFEERSEKGEERKMHKSFFTVVADELNIENELTHEIRKRGIYEAILYTNKATFSGKFDFTKLQQLNVENRIIFWEDASLNIGISDSHAVNGASQIKFNEIKSNLEPGILTTNALGLGIHAKLNLSQDQAVNHFEFELEFRGTASLAFEPSANSTNITVKADWPSPSFYGSNFPVERDITDTQFSAQWNTSQFSRSYPDYWKGEKYQLQDPQSKMGVKLIQTVDHYQRNNRSIKYSLLIIALSFMIFFFFEYLQENKIHPIQYAMVGLALSIFYLLLISLSEHIGFDKAYWVSTLATIGLITIYTSAILKDRKYLVVLFLSLLAVYSFIYVILQLEDIALLVGSIGLFVVLATVMILSRKVNWYQISSE